MRNQTENNPKTLVIRAARDSDRGALARLAELDDAPELGGERILVAEVEGTPRAALLLDTGAAIGDPFHPSASLIDLLRVRAAQLNGSDPGESPGRLRSWLTGLRRPEPEPTAR